MRHFISLILFVAFCIMTSTLAVAQDTKKSREDLLKEVNRASSFNTQSEKVETETVTTTTTFDMWETDESRLLLGAQLMVIPTSKERIASTMFQLGFEKPMLYGVFIEPTLGAGVWQPDITKWKSNWKVDFSIHVGYSVTDWFRIRSGTTLSSMGGRYSGDDSIGIAVVDAGFSFRIADSLDLNLGLGTSYYGWGFSSEDQPLWRSQLFAFAGLVIPIELFPDHNEEE